MTTLNPRPWCSRYRGGRADTSDEGRRLNLGRSSFAGLEGCAGEVTFIFDAQEVDGRDRADLVRHLLASFVMPMEVHWPQAPSEVVCRVEITDLGGATLCSGRSNASLCERSSALARDSSEPCIVVEVQGHGTATVEQDGRQVTAHQGDLVIYRSTAPVTVANGSGLSGTCLRIPHTLLGLPLGMVEKSTAAALCPGDPVSKFAFDHLCRMATDRELRCADVVTLLGNPSVELVRAVIATHVGSRTHAASSLAETLQIQILEFVRTHLGDPELTGPMIAAAHHISVRYLYKIMAANGIGLADWIRQHRLQAVQRALTTASSDVSISAIARAHGFSDMSSFSRSFRSAFGHSPREWRQRG